MRRARQVWRGHADDGGAATVDFVLISALLVILLLVVLEVAVYFYARNVAAESAADAARYAASAGVRADAGSSRARLLIGQGLDDRDAAALRCTSHVGRHSGLRTVTVRCHGNLRLFFTPFTSELPITVQSTVLKEQTP